ncbi:hypothetical protein LTR37_014088 [Vermiconidia calcicola]|uniref:Uncharacterized protein n=1 Tax=Vermiconidia calcicola TaxID=1690605 RepID=A0ACC3MW17_9PEZI|nr:hypothetical protein LTR37_014088 [Vermiconidia calcicola]
MSPADEHEIQYLEGQLFNRDNQIEALNDEVKELRRKNASLSKANQDCETEITRLTSMATGKQSGQVPLSQSHAIRTLNVRRSVLDIVDRLGTLEDAITEHRTACLQKLQGLSKRLDSVVKQQLAGQDSRRVASERVAQLERQTTTELTSASDQSGAGHHLSEGFGGEHRTNKEYAEEEVSGHDEDSNDEDSNDEDSNEEDSNDEDSNDEDEDENDKNGNGENGTDEGGNDADENDEDNNDKNGNSEKGDDEGDNDEGGDDSARSHVILHQCHGCEVLKEMLGKLIEALRIG